MQSTNLLALPTELVQEIARQLDSPAQLSLRLSCRQMNAKTYHTFRDAHFTTRRHIFTEHSLQGLVSLAQHPSLAPAVQHLELSLLPFEQRDRNAMHDPTSPYHVPCASSRAALTTFLDAQACSHRTGQDAALLTRALQRLSNLRTLRITNRPDACWGFHSMGRALGWPNYVVRGQAAAAHPQQHALPSVYGFETALAALAASSGAFALHELDIAGGLPLAALALPTAAAAARLSASMAHVRVLTLFVSLPMRLAIEAGTAQSNNNNTDDNDDDETSNKHFLSLFPHLEVLRLGAARGRPSNLDHFLADVVLRAPWPRLKGLHLLHLDAQKEGVLQHVLAHCAALEYLVLEDGRARESCWRPAMRYAAEAHPALVGVLCKRFEVVADDAVVLGGGAPPQQQWGGDGEVRSPFLEYDTQAVGGSEQARHLVVDREAKWVRQRFPWRFFTVPEFWRRDRVFFQMRG
ncbi:F-box domain cyclin-like protein [Macrophomina phaseolina MS6]|uniref:F-box domain cyclin-like protein n=1 Tax=Macrophomina phaseolina (strain MS6) TaxID=1126212 RepID=K2S5F5_MACPH|nr:F-box domain cyclin-like protein [Macrophomina phaseolina MS6]